MRGAIRYPAGGLPTAVSSTARADGVSSPWPLTSGRGKAISTWGSLRMAAVRGPATRPSSVGAPDSLLPCRSELVPVPEPAGIPTAPMPAPGRMTEAVKVPASGALPEGFTAQTAMASTPLAATARTAGRHKLLGPVASFPDTA
ncbi:hypothetical protein [Pseudarthrobacter oxydans]|uniref:hypothetical protein n=1 Tax=Pseudarthrobacter oxydans TaxID=1671 RepID=UPI00380A895A